MTSLAKDATVEFRFFRPQAGEVTLAGDFSGDWSQRLTMRRDANGWWTLRLTLRGGEYRFRYVADGEWYTDFASNGVEVNKLGWNSVLVVPARIAGAARANAGRDGAEARSDNDALLVA